jgi:hypothetical protein
MSNPVSLYVGETQLVLEELRNIDRDSDNPKPKLKDYLAENDSDMFTCELSELFDRVKTPLSAANDRFLRLILWSWIGDTKPSFLPKAMTDGLGLDLAIPPDSIVDLATIIQDINTNSLAQSLFSMNEIWITPLELELYLNCWVDAFKDAIHRKEGVFYKIWV